MKVYVIMAKTYKDTEYYVYSSSANKSSAEKSVKENRGFYEDMFVEQVEVTIPSPITIYTLIDSKGNIAESAFDLESLKEAYIMSSYTVVETTGIIRK